MQLAGFSLTPARQVMRDQSPPRGYLAEVSTDGQSWTQQVEGEFSNIAYALSTQRIPFRAPVAARYLRLSFPEVAVPAGTLAIAGIGGFTAR